MEKPFTSNRSDRLIYPLLSLDPPINPVININRSSPGSHLDSTRVSSHPSTSHQLSPSSKTGDSPRSPLAEPTFIFPPQSSTTASSKALPSVTLRSAGPNPILTPRLPRRGSHTMSFDGDSKIRVSPNQSTPPLAPTWTALASTHTSPDRDVLPLLKATFSSPSSSASTPPSTPCPAVVSDDMREKIKELLSKSSQGLWADALPKCFKDVYKMPFPEEILENLSSLCDICTVEYPFPHNKKRVRK